MTITYLTLESYLKEPILKSQVESFMLSLEKRNMVFNLVTFEDKPYSCIIKKNITHYQLRRRFYFLDIIVLIFFVLKIVKKDHIVHVRSYPPMFAALFLKLLYKCKVIFDPRGLWPEEINFMENRLILSRLFGFFEKYFVMFSDIVIFVSYPFQKLFFQRYKISNGKSYVITTYAIPHEIKNNLTCQYKNLRNDFFNCNDAIIFVYSGSIAEYQMIDEVIEYFKLAISEIPNSRFLFLSKSVDQFNLKLNDKLDKSKYLVLSADYNDIGHYLSQCNYGLLFRESHIINRVAAPIKVKDYLLARIKLICTNDIGDTSSLIDNFNVGYILNDLSKTSMLSSLKRLVHDNFSIISEESYKKISDIYSVETIAKEYSQVYIKLSK